MSLRRIRALPCWQGEVRAERLSGGLSNESWKVRDAAGAHVVRFGKDFPFHHVSRASEVIAARAAHRTGFAPAVEHAGPGVMVSAFLEARTWEEVDMRANPDRIARLLQAFHTDMPAEVSGPGAIFWVFHVIRDYARTLADNGSRFAPELPWLTAVAAEMEAAQVPLPIIFGHHDLLPGNFLEDAGGRVWLIDFEYAAFGTAMFDLAGAASNAGMSDDEARALLVAYFGAAPDAALLRAFEAMQCASLAREAMWAMVSEIFLAAPGADYDAHARDYLGRLGAALDRYHTRHGKTSS
ncbi:choline/ethanolamine kinase family protein [Defluviimonas sp. WL0075]|uniref:Phosphotransferase family protein n=1 Tax=Albidovulum sediminicola TaxID=2984331 RepID=A0ABT2Z0C9_9RHOB|nr:choline/ethanolamine kinase family protein [Defluviimonas sp. WL0075]MCV2864472.1 phosphotransferase family protein [Defluviimonas sp. WL0075]